MTRNESDLLKEIEELQKQIDVLKKAERENKEAEKALKESEELYRMLVRMSPLAIAMGLHGSPFPWRRMTANVDIAWAQRYCVSRSDGSETTSSLNRAGIAPRVGGNLSRPAGHAVKRVDRDAENEPRCRKQVPR